MFENSGKHDTDLNNRRHASPNIKRDFYLDVYTIVIWILINNIEHMRISGNESSSVIFGQTMEKKSQKWKVMTQKCPNKLKPKGMV